MKSSQPEIEATGPGEPAADPGASHPLPAAPPLPGTARLLVVSPDFPPGRGDFIFGNLRRQPSPPTRWHYVISPPRTPVAEYGGAVVLLRRGFPLLPRADRLIIVVPPRFMETQGQAILLRRLCGSPPPSAHRTQGPLVVRRSD